MLDRENFIYLFIYLALLSCVKNTLLTRVNVIKIYSKLKLNEFELKSLAKSNQFKLQSLCLTYVFIYQLNNESILTKARSTLATMSKQHCRSNWQLCCLLLRQCCRFGQQCRSHVRLCRRDEISTQNSFDIVAVFGHWLGEVSKLNQDMIAEIKKTF